MKKILPSIFLFFLALLSIMYGSRNNGKQVPFATMTGTLPNNNINHTATIPPSITAIPTKSTIVTEVSKKLSTLSPGEYLLYTSSEDGLFVYSMTDKLSKKIDAGISNYIGISSDYQLIAYTKPYATFILEIDKNEQIRIASSKSCTNPQFSQDNSLLLLDCSGEPDGENLVLYDISEKTPKIILDCGKETLNCNNASWLPNNNYISYSLSHAYSGEDYDAGLYLLDTGCIHNSECERGTKIHDFVLAYAWLPDNEQVVILIPGHLQLYQLTGSKLIFLQELMQLDWGEKIIKSPDDSKLAITSEDGNIGIYSFDKGTYEEIPIGQYNFVQAWIIVK